MVNLFSHQLHLLVDITEDYLQRPGAMSAVCLED